MATNKLSNFFSLIRQKFKNLSRYDMHGNKSKRKLVIAVSSLLILIVVIAVFAGSLVKVRSLTGYVVQQEQELEETKSKLNTFEQDLETKNQELASKGQELQSLQDQLLQKDATISGLKSDLESNAQQVSSLENEVDDLTEENDKLQNKNDEFTEAIESSAWQFCCTFNDFQNNIERSWDISDGEIQCNSGSYTVSCNTGETNFNKE